MARSARANVPTAYRPPLYPLLLTGCVALGDYSRAAVGVLHLALGVATVGLVLVLGRWWGLGNRRAALAALLVACDPILLSQSTQVMTETPAAFLATAGLVALTWASRNPSACRTIAWRAACRPLGGALPAHAAALDDRRRGRCIWSIADGPRCCNSSRSIAEQPTPSWTLQTCLVRRSFWRG